VDKPVFPPQAEDWRAIDAAQRHVDDKLSALRAYHRRAASSLMRQALCDAMAGIGVLNNRQVWRWLDLPILVDRTCLGVTAGFDMAVWHNVKRFIILGHPMLIVNLIPTGSKRHKI